MIYGWAWKKGFVFFSLLSHRVHTALSWFHPPQNLHLPPRPVTQHIQLKIICVYVTSLPLCYLTTDQILEKRNKAFIVLSDSFQSARRNLTGLVLKVLFLSIVSLWKKKIYSRKRWVLHSGFEYAELGELAPRCWWKVPQFWPSSLHQDYLSSSSQHYFLTFQLQYLQQRFLLLLCRMNWGLPPCYEYRLTCKTSLRSSPREQLLHRLLCLL